MTHVQSLLDAHPKHAAGIDKAKLVDCMQACFDCAQTCTACTDACLNEDMVAELTKCIRANQHASMRRPPRVAGLSGGAL